MLSPTPSRRTFVAHLAALVGASALLPDVSAGGVVDRAPQAPGDEPEAWLTAITGKHRQIFHSHEDLSNGLFYATRYKTAYAKEYGVEPGEVNSILAAHGKTGAITYNDAAWKKYGFGEWFDIKESPKSKKFATHNIFLTSPDDGENPGVMEAMKAGVVVLSCRTALRGAAAALAKRNKFGSAEEIERDLTASLVTGVILVPAMVIAIERAQKQGCAYQFTG
jgi:hypothetical protein